jgi:hypothetical protein
MHLGHADKGAEWGVCDGGDCKIGACKDVEGGSAREREVARGSARKFEGAWGSTGGARGRARECEGSARVCEGSVRECEGAQGSTGECRPAR